MTTGKDMSTPSRDLQRQILKRFLQITSGRLARLQLDLNKDQQVFLTALPVLLHSRISSSPCFDSEHTPCGISRYKPGAIDIQKVQRVLPQLDANTERVDKPDILGLYISSNCGTLSNSAQPEITLWLCHRDDLGSNEIGLLHRKCGSIAGWGKVLGIAVDFRIFDTQFDSQHSEQGVKLFQHKDQYIDHQRTLQLDRFYSSAILLAGRMPLWWFIPASEEYRYKQYSSILRHKKFVSDDDIIDLGFCDTLPTEEIINFAIEQLNSDNGSRYKQHLRLAQSEYLMQKQPVNTLTSHSFKQAIYDEQMNLDLLDPQWLQFQLMDQLLQDAPQQQDTLRRSFYYACGMHQSKTDNSWQTKYFDSLMQSWNWAEDQQEWLKHPQWWSTQQRIAEDLHFSAARLQTYHRLMAYVDAQEHEHESDYPALTSLAHKLFAQCQHAAGKIHTLAPDFCEQTKTEQLYLRYTQEQWFAYQDDEYQQAVYQNTSLLTLLCWCQRNHLLQTKVTLDSNYGTLTQQILDQAVEAIRNAFGSASATDFSHRAIPQTLLMFVNFSGQNAKATPGLTNTLDTPSGKRIVIQSIETLCLNSWGEVYCKRFDGAVALFNCINDYMQQVPPGTDAHLPALHIFNFEADADETIHRLTHLFRDLNACYHTGLQPANSRFILQMQKQFFITQHENNTTQFKGARNNDNLIKRLGEKQSDYSPIIFERHTLTTSVLSAISAIMRKDAVQIFFSDNGNQQASVYILDEKGSLFTYQQEFHDAKTLLQPLETFLQSALYRQSTSSDYHSQNQFIDIDVLYYQIHHQDQQPPLIKSYPLQNHLAAQHAFSIQAIAEPGSDGNPVFNIYCDQQEFSAVDWGSELYSSVARFILAKRKSGGRYPCHISDLDLSSINALTHESSQTVDYLRFKVEIESGINEALQRV